MEDHGPVKKAQGLKILVLSSEQPLGGCGPLIGKAERRRDLEYHKETSG